MNKLLAVNEHVLKEGSEMQLEESLSDGQSQVTSPWELSQFRDDAFHSGRGIFHAITTPGYLFQFSAYFISM